MTALKPKYTLFDSLEQMLAPETLSKLLSKPVTRVEVKAMEHGGLAGSQLSHVVTDAGRLVLKTMSPETDWGMFATNDHLCRAATLWQYGLLDQLLPHADHKILACAREGNTWTIMMDDLSDTVFNWEKNPITSELIPSLIDTLARLHSNFWNNSDLKDSQLGLCSPAEFLYTFSLSSAQKDSGQAQSVVKDWIITGWEVMEELLDARIFRQMLSLTEDSSPLLKAMERYPFTLLHGDFRSDNLAYTDRFVFLDWQIAAYSLMTMDLAWLTRDIRDLIDRERAIQIYRQRLETHLNQHFDDTEWQAMIELGYAADAMGATSGLGNWYKFEENPDLRETAKNLIIQQGQMVMDALHLL